MCDKQSGEIKYRRWLRDTELWERGGGCVWDCALGEKRCAMDTCSQEKECVRDTEI